MTVSEPSTMSTARDGQAIGVLYGIWAEGADKILQHAVNGVPGTDKNTFMLEIYVACDIMRQRGNSLKLMIRISETSFPKWRQVTSSDKV